MNGKGQRENAGVTDIVIAMDTITPPPTPAVLPTAADDDPRSQANIERRKTLKLAERDERGRLYPGSVLERAGRPVGPTVTSLARQYTAEAITCLAAVMEDEKAPQAARVTAAQALLDRGWGKAPVQIDLNARQRFDDFLREVGIAARFEHEHAVVAETEETGE
jgi:hypothetical protein